MSTKATNLDTLGKIHLGKLLLTEPEYEKLYEERVARLTSIKVSSVVLTGSFTKAADLTKESHLVANDLLSTMEFIEGRFPSTTIDKLNLVSKMFQRAKANGDEMDVSEEVSRRLRDTTEKADEFILWLSSKRPIDEAWSAHLDIKESLRQRCKDEREFDRELIESQVVMRLQTLKSLQLQLDTLVQMYTLLKIFRGMLYVGAFSVEGGKLDRKKRVDELVDLVKTLGKQVAGIFIPSIGSIIDVAELIYDWLKRDISPELLKNADFVESYIESYSGLLTQWNVVARNLNDSVLSSAKAVLGGIKGVTSKRVNNAVGGDIYSAKP